MIYSTQETINFTKDMAYLIESSGDDTICAHSLKLADEYVMNIFSLLSDMKSIQRFTLTTPTNLPPQEYLIVVSKEGPLLLNESITFSLYKITTIETGWIRSIKVRTPRLVKVITVKAIEHISSSPIFIDHVEEEIDVVDEEIVEEEIDSVDEEIVDEEIDEEERTQFFNSVTVVDTPVADTPIYNEQIKKEIIIYVKEKLLECERALGRRNKMDMCIQLFEKLSEPAGIIFIQKHDRFSNVVKAKMIEFYYQEDFVEMGAFYKRIFGEEIPAK